MIRVRKACVAYFAYMSMACVACAEIPSSDEINLAFSRGGTNQDVFERVYPYLTNINCGVWSPANGLEDARFCVMTNVLAMTLATNGDLVANFNPIRRFLGYIGDYDCVRTNHTAMLNIASYIGGFEEISTNNYAMEMAAARQGTNFVQCARRWRSILSFNSRIKDFRVELAAEYSDGYKACLASLPDDQKAAFTSNVVEAARFNAEELRQLQRGIWDD